MTAIRRPWLFFSLFLFACGAHSSPPSAATNSRLDPASSGPTGSSTVTGCSANGSCPNGGTCCNNLCVDLSSDPTNCGGCGIDCNTGSNFCNSQSCSALQFSALCSNKPSLTIASDGEQADDQAAQVAAGAISATCKWPAASLVSQSGSAEDAGTGRPDLGSGNTLVMAGGFFYQQGVKYLEQSAASTPVYFFINSSNQYIIENRANGQPIVTTAAAGVTPHHDYGVIEMTPEALSGTLCVIVFGLESQGTAAAAYYFSNGVIGQASAASLSWLVIEWTDTNNDGTPNQGDSFHLLASG